MMNAPLTLSHPIALLSLSLSILGLLSALGVFWLRKSVILPELKNLQQEQREVQQELKEARQELAIVKDQMNEALGILSELHLQARLLTVFRVILSVALLLGRTGALALVFRFLNRHIWWQTLAKEGIDELVERLRDYLNSPRTHRS
ncbi:hypothetical protein COW36_04685 [bacterium (Candidatus Blackallbacteria) CG17_big_fil_post_rev_8_21_14_2_50_48_46]|uniref:Uncharacterized protein n=1 Tax=bacterium (Candidatus Blackallbacteria) CG17_big_fil_post_rev_8_21_14_2_50_48_46 TaxID=2014261 RepID=A0A2M7G972_9BACT|nr:MAG: hypothetical protein COW64_04260 [bacterium (Candidatus Blackallbacteria) CG18_big_fil_WC_8_21_14_2_50_49_26]PIW18591.1 MAG: hypothetical protein COW36_04685 [bacterium (Candidatus Blackallbacteria) CG17_big_fil_post_rev_8_21_14_2_50_48_46]PIW46423.1 MAG: hypothetical protein COW20_15995 [bacterium (Candidatus Blackallbacteria) CG13_big_fil_rev_8_21_14_2_50_49_14]